ncbi:MAG: hypothetical protein NVSMB7_14050 [Chitinophagaceae bacterium]
MTSPGKYSNTIIMIIEIHDTLTIGEISEAFTSGFPFLSIMVFKSPHVWGAASSLQQRIPAGKTLAEVRTTHLHGAMEIHAWHKTGAIEQEFGKLFGLYVQVFRREGVAWVQTADTDSRTLEEQNEAGRNASLELLDGTDNRFNNENPSW